ncbi:MAG TPA: hypothetical protein VKI65_05910, partial [Gemmataceae bacterium]|nr:hypothetical protein [Gemmataceae bacterium]
RLFSIMPFFANISYFEPEALLAWLRADLAATIADVYKNKHAAERHRTPRASCAAIGISSSWTRPTR